MATANDAPSLPLSGTQRYAVKVAWVPEGNGRPVENTVLVNASNKVFAITLALRPAALAGSGIPYDADITSISLSTAIIRGL